MHGAGRERRRPVRLPASVVPRAGERDDLLDTLLGLRITVLALPDAVLGLPGTVLGTASQSDAGRGRAASGVLTRGPSVLRTGVADLLLRAADDLPMVVLAGIVDAASAGERGGPLHGLPDHDLPPNHPANALAVAPSQACDELPAGLLTDVCAEL